MSDPQFDVIAIGNAIVDVMAPCDEATIERLGMARGGGMLVDNDPGHAPYETHGPGRRGARGDDAGGCRPRA